MTVQELFPIIKQVSPYLFGGGGVLMFLTERKKRKIDLAQQETSALQSMQKAYDDFVKDARESINGFKSEINDLKKELKEVREDFRNYRQDHKNC